MKVCEGQTKEVNSVESCFLARITLATTHKHGPLVNLFDFSCPNVCSWGEIICHLMGEVLGERI